MTEPTVSTRKRQNQHWPIRPVLDRLFDNSIPEPNSGCWLWLAGLHSDGYGLIRDGRTRTAHRVMWEQLHGPLGEGECVLHRCDNRLCVNPDHLWLGTLRDNAIDMARKKRAGGQKITSDQALAIRQDPRPLTEVGATYGLSIAQVSRIRSGKRFAHV